MFTKITVLCFCAMLGEITPAAIPMWEYLSKDEKMSYLYSTFANQVEDFCEFSHMRNCNHELLRFGLNKLKEMPEDHLDTMDPYQRGAHGLIWDSMMDGHEVMQAVSTKRPRGPTTTAKPNSYEDTSFGQDYQSEGSARVETVYNYKIVPSRLFPQYSVSSGPSQYRPSKIQPSKYNQNNLQAYPYQSYQDEDYYSQSPLTGPMVVRVHLDGTPVKEQPEIPHDEDLRQHKMSKVGLPVF